MNGVVKANIKELKSFDEKKFNPKPIYETENIKVIIAYFKPGQFIPVNTPAVDVVLCILEGKAEVVAGDEKIPAKEGDVIVVPKGIKRGIKALADLSVLHVVQPSPSEADHEEVHAKIKAGKFE